MLIRKAIMKDITDIQKVAKETWNDTYEGIIPRDIQDRFIARAYSDENLERRIKKSLFLVATVNDSVIGFANFFFKQTEAVLGAIYIEPSEHGKGIGSDLLSTGIKELNEVTRILVEVEAGNKVGVAFYQAKGFYLVEEYDDHFDGHILKTKRMALDL
ncbi:GNAT family N-acetyltransferase [Alkalihalophilus lindianensis]|uniref:GNAT family N-acetyltransferase n=1 Tax=Alkalihalophilus lindianensis TaxID=1630542 RepID=A0ABU3X4E8_9BACI|nr:GNAT family N-acetyltransferase [Alkalihalophilus lindianensis]MDV2682771.1 GNAT family N-acetyltransferase [Alkalihalophilus lindianensis]